jgi:hypothetical protein
MVRRIVVGLCRRLILYDWYHIMEQDGEEDSCRFVYEVNSIELVSYNEVNSV